MTALPLARESLFVYVGAVAAAWAVLLAALGLSRHDFPPKGGERVIIAISVLLVAGSIATAILTATSGPKAHGGVAIAPATATPPGGPKTGGPGTGPTSAPPGSTGVSAKLAISADPSGQLRFNTNKLAAKAGPVQITLSNPSPLSHNVSLQGPGVAKQGPTVSHGQTSTVSATLKPGTYTFYCSVPGHRQAGMVGTLTVR